MFELKNARDDRETCVQYERNLNPATLKLKVIGNIRMSYTKFKSHEGKICNVRITVGQAPRILVNLWLIVASFCRKYNLLLLHFS